MTMKMMMKRCVGMKRNSNTYTQTKTSTTSTRIIKNHAHTIKDIKGNKQKYEACRSTSEQGEHPKEKGERTWMKETHVVQDVSYAGRRKSVSSMAVVAAGTMTIANESVRALLMPEKALALLEQDEDLELLEKIRAKKQVRLTVEAQLATLQSAVDKLRLAGQLIGSEGAGDSDQQLRTVLGTSTPWMQELRTAADKMNTSPETKRLAAAFFADYDGLAASVAKGDGKMTKTDYVKTTKSFQTWCKQAGIANELNGLF